jgi:hypothetical protein
MRVTFDVTGRMRTMPRSKLRPTLEEVADA